MTHDIDFAVICMVLGYNTRHYAELENMAFDEMADIAQYIFNKYLESDPKTYQYASQFAFDYIHETFTPTEDAE